MLDAIASDTSNGQIIILNGAAKHGKFNYSMRRPSSSKSLSLEDQKPEPVLDDSPVQNSAWKKLGLKVERTTDADIRATRYAAAVKLVGIGDEPIPPDVARPMILTHIARIDVHDFGRLSQALDRFDPKTDLPLPIRCTVVTPCGKVFIDFLPGRGGSDAKLAGPPSQQKQPFPSLEDQKLADLAWKRLGLELEPIGDDDAKRVKALGYDGGLRVGGKPRSVVVIGADQVGENILTGDILVGLYVWPVTNLKDIAKSCSVTIWPSSIRSSFR